MARVSETNQQNRNNGAPVRQPRIAMLIRRNGTWREVAFERRVKPFPSGSAIAAGFATATPQER